jgi:hypothetical protein
MTCANFSGAAHGPGHHDLFIGSRLGSNFRVRSPTPWCVRQACAYGMILQVSIRSEGARMQPLSDHDHAAWEAVVQAARKRAAVRQKAMVDGFGLAGNVQYKWSLDEAQISWSRDSSVFLSARITMIGSVNIPRQTWLWSWANDSLPPAVLGDIGRVRDYGEANGFPVLPWEGFNYHPDLIAEARYVSAAVLEAEGLWSETLKDAQLHFLIHDLTPCAG